MAAAQGPGAPTALDETLATLVEGLRALSVLLTLHAGEHPRCSPRSARRNPATRRPRSPPRATGVHVERCTPLFPQAVIDSHTHLHSCREPDEELVAAAAPPPV